MLNKRWKILNPKQHFFFLEKRKPVLKEKIIGLFLSLGFWYLIKPLQGLRGRGAEPHMFSISDLEFRVYKWR